MSDKRWSENIHLADDAEAGGVVQTWIDGNVDTIQAGFAACIDVLDQIRKQLSERVGQTLDWAEGFPSGAFTLARHINRGADTFAAHAIRATDRFGRSILSGVRNAGHGARNFASDTTSTIIGHGAVQAEIMPPRVPQVARSQSPA